MTLSDKPIILVGMMGCGKTTIGRGLAAALKRGFFDSDREIEKTAGKTITEMFRSEGEAAFRRQEGGVLRTLLGAGHSVIAAGGGAFQDQQTRAFVKQKALSIWLSGAGDVFFQRAQKGGTRPLLEGAGAWEKFMALYRVRMPGYAQAEFHIASDGAPVETIIEDIINVTGIKRDKG
ncbi:MAG: shikimate kinase [Proteobacteria bacterium]|nr:shikimate kinase [Pseudomonadota bacterium]